MTDIEHPTTEGTEAPELSEGRTPTERDSAASDGSSSDPEPPPSVADESSATRGERAAAAVELLGEIVSHMGYELAIECTEGSDRIDLEITGDDAAELVGRKGQTLDALQFLLGRMLNRRCAGRRPVVIDCDGYRQRRAEALTDLAQRLGEKASRSGKTVAVNPMSAHDRRVIHMALRDTPGITTRSEGDGLERRLLIIPQPK